MRGLILLWWTLFAALGAAIAQTNESLSPPGLTISAVASFASPWAMAFTPDGRLLVTEVLNGIRIVDPNGTVSPVVVGSPYSIYDVAVDPDFRNNDLIYYSHTDFKPWGMRLVVSRASLLRGSSGYRLGDIQDIWVQSRMNRNRGNFGARLIFSPDKRYLFISSGDRGFRTLPLNLANNIGKIIRIFPDGKIPDDNPYVGNPWAMHDIWSSGHRNAYGFAFDSDGRFWQHEMGPKGGDELNVIHAGGSYGWPRTSNGDQYNGRPIPRHHDGDGYVSPVISWTPVIAPAGLILYTGTLFSQWRENLIISGLMYHGLVRLKLDGEKATEVERIPLGARIREVEQGPDGAIWVLEDRPPGRLLKITPRSDDVFTKQ